MTSKHPQRPDSRWCSVILTPVTEIPVVVLLLPAEGRQALRTLKHASKLELTSVARSKTIRTQYHDNEPVGEKD